MRKYGRTTKILAGCVVAGGLALGTTSLVFAQPSPQLPIESSAEQAAFADELDAFLAANPEPREDEFGYAVGEQNEYWEAQAAWWESVPWTAVAGQWGCTTDAVSVSFNPPRPDGVITAGYGGSGDCGGFYDGGDAAIFSDPRPKAEILKDNPDLTAE